MEQNPFDEKLKIEPIEEKPINYPLAIIGAIGGAAVGVAIWAAAAAFTDSYYYITPVLIGAFAGGAASRLAGRGHISLAIIGLLIGTLGIVIGDFLETALVLDWPIAEIPQNIDTYIDIMQLKFDEDMIQGITYLIGIGFAFFSGFTNPKDSGK